MKKPNNSPIALLLLAFLCIYGNAVAQTSHTDEANHLKVTTTYGYVQIGPQNYSWSHFSTDRDKFYFNKPIYVNGTIHSYTGNNMSIGTYGQTQITVLESNGNVGIGTTTPIGKLHLKGDLYLDGSSTDASGAQETFLSYKGHHLIIGSQSGVYRNNILNIRPGGSSSGTLSSSFRMYKVLNENDNMDELKVLIHSNGNSYFNGGNVGIGTTIPDEKLTVKGKVHSEEVRVEAVGADFVFEPNYNLMPLAETEAYIKANRHLPEVPSAAEMQANG